MSTSTVAKTDTETVITDIEEFLKDAIQDGNQYLKSSDIAEATGYSTKKVAALINTIDDRQNNISITKWGYTSSTTWLVEPGT